MLLTGRADGPAFEWRLGKFRWQVWVLGAASPVSLRIAGLRHEPCNNAVKSQAVVEAFSDKLFDALNMLRCEVGPKFDDNTAVLKIQVQGILGASGAGALKPKANASTAAKKQERNMENLCGC